MRLKHLNLKRYSLYLIRWQLSTPILAIVLLWLNSCNKWIATIIANLIGGLIFFWVDRFIFTSKKLDSPEWEVVDQAVCFDCGKLDRGYRIKRAKNYDRSETNPQFRCEECSKKKTEELRKRGIDV